ncbi:MAG: flagellar hook protein, partial [Proteobacteria bacterium]|nr:flagellar hook protein [Pseudomonadota bacterium]
KTAGAAAITETDVWTSLDGHTLVGGEVIKFSGYKANGTAVEGSYTVNLADQLSVFMTAIETAYGGVVNAGIQDGRIVLTDGTSNSTLRLQIFEPSGSGVDFGTLSGGVTGRYSVNVTASKDASDHLVLTHHDYGSSATFSISQSGADLGLGAVTAGVNVAGTINGEAAAGSGQLLTGSAPATGMTTSVQGLTVKYTGTATGTQGTVKITMGVAELFDRTLFSISDPIEGYAGFKQESLQNSIDSFETQIEQMEARLNRKMEMMINRFVAMETALARMQSQSNWLSGQINASLSGWM